jgi:mannose-6-phosphate isomerase-like protein (cupin superfamily)
MFENVRRVVTVIDDNGVSRIESDGDAVPGDISATGDPEEFSFLSPANGFLVRRVEVPPDSSRFFDETGGPRLPEAHEGMHQTATIDILQILEGELWCLLDSGEETCLRAGDVIVQRGTVHAWRNRTEEVTRYLAIMVTAPLPHPIEHHANP